MIPALLALLACAGELPCAARPEGGDPGLLDGASARSLLVISLDTARPEYLAAEAPALAAWMEGALVLADHWSCTNWTFGAMVCAQAGLRPFDAGFIAERGGGSWAVVPEEVALASEVLADAGWRTALVSSNTNFSGDVGLDAGFQSVWVQTGAGARQVSEQALDFLADPGDGPWYLHAHYADPHLPYDPPPEYLDGLEALAPIDYDLSDREQYRRLSAEWPGLSEPERERVLDHIALRYAAEHRYADDQIGRLLAHPALEGALVVFFTDHGEQFFEHDRFGHGLTVYGEELRAIAAFAAPGLAPGRWEGPSSHQDIWPTIAAILGVELPEAFGGWPAGRRPADGVRSGLRLLEDGGLVQFAECGGEKLLRAGAREERYLLAEDPRELADRAAEGSGPAPLAEALAADREALEALR